MCNILWAAGSPKVCGITDSGNEPSSVGVPTYEIALMTQIHANISAIKSRGESNAQID